MTDNKTGEPRALVIIPRTIDEVRTLSTLLAKSSLLPEAMRGQEANVAMAILAGQEMGLAPMAAIRGIHVVKGKPILSAETMVGIVLGSGLAEHFTCTEETPTRVTYETKRRGAPREQRCTWTMDDAKRAGLDGDNWRKYPRAMLKARCKSMLARDVYPDVLAGCYDEDEAREIERTVATRLADVSDAEVVSETVGPNVDALLKAIDDAPTLDELKALGEQCVALKGDAKSEAQTRWVARRKLLYAQSQPAEQPIAEQVP